MKAPAFWDENGWPAHALRPLGFAYTQLAEARLRQAPAGAVAAPVICVGNFTLGGAGKTPTVLMLTRLLRGAGYQPFVLSRGYGGRLKGPLLVDRERHDAGSVGDEPSLMAQEVPVVIGADRLASARLAMTCGAHILVMDDGLQNPRLKRDVCLAVVDGQSGIGNGQVFPAGPLRARLKAQFEVVDALIVIGEGERGHDMALKAHRAGCLVFHANLVPDDQMRRLNGLKSLAFCGIGRPEKFRSSLEKCGVDVRGFIAFPDHHVISKTQADDLLRRAATEGLALVTTAKDQARLLGDPYTRQVLAGLVNVAGIDLVLEDQATFTTWLKDKIAQPPV